MSGVRVTFLGTGTSHGVPMIGCRCDTCLSTDPKDKRWRPSLHLQLEGGVSVLVDASPDLRAQALTFNVTRVDAILFTHSHADHVFGLDEIRRYNDLQKQVVPCYGDERTLAEIRHTFAYAFGPLRAMGGVPRLELLPIRGPFCIARSEFVPVPVIHGSETILGFRIGEFAYLTDCSAIPETSWPLLDGVRLLAIDALRHRPHPTHFSVGEALAVIERLRPERAWFTHICHDLPHAATSATLPPGVEMAYDGLTLDIG